VLKLTRSARNYSRYIGLILYPPWVTLPASERSRWRTKTQLLHWDRRPPPWCWSGDPWEPMAKRKSSCGYIRCKLVRCRILYIYIYNYIYIYMWCISFLIIYIHIYVDTRYDCIWMYNGQNLNTEWDLVIKGFKSCQQKIRWWWRESVCQTGS